MYAESGLLHATLLTHRTGAHLGLSWIRQQQLVSLYGPLLPRVSGSSRPFPLRIADVSSPTRPPLSAVLHSVPASWWAIVRTALGGRRLPTGSPWLRNGLPRASVPTWRRTLTLTIRTRSPNSPSSWQSFPLLPRLFECHLDTSSAWIRQGFLVIWKWPLHGVAWGKNRTVFAVVVVWFRPCPQVDR
ncbi:uncharacterized protein B0I36DRAFT_58952 [Microdochium trichocladiopsis]|uniref:Uncharacterized protein n=1 Tax=Microdochium trichocladiopsis TaxID=1682393 RepID=A0A9P8XSJ1_9PEZI|nr:uncharacterized protein B0I36DRAFT_58952 [Microdochium trichocladiopsis]KAH7009371.1 hypothetical protein B0I36DRAFT_58952 [Microdochium trichocladiopsis]